MAELELRQYIRATKQRVWDVISDIPSQAQWMVDVRTLEVTSNVSSGLGTTIKLTSDLFGLPVVHDVMDFVTWDEPNEIGIVHRGMFTGRASFLLRDAPGGGCIFIWREEINPPMGLLGDLGFKLVIREHLTQVFSRSMRNVRDIAEGITAA